MERGSRQIWFPAKRYGWGWGPPVCWQGWVVLIVWMAVLCCGTIFLTPAQPATFGAFIGGMSGILVVICYLKGEKPRWRWGGR